jgi:hypothetical protein
MKSPSLARVDGSLANDLFMVKALVTSRSN